ncbi:ADP-ribosylglycohydrolase family protein [Janibacter sp. GXQ6167]|uniref:ADP-ribosylglycohydrolase family protein n=1 Tax=Janibacter sp. GXQ6167 TaxID=3240791 RepID=UPI003525D37E
MKLTIAQTDRALGAILGSAAGDALGAGYEFGSAYPGRGGPRMIGGGLGGFAPGEWTDDTAMTWCVLQAASEHEDLRAPEALTAIARLFRAWIASGPADIGVQTSAVLRSVGADVTGDELTQAAAALHRRTGRTAGNGSLMRTAAVALRHLDDPSACAEAARAVSDLTHADPLAGDACVLWSLAIRHAILTGEIDVRVGLDYLSEPANWPEVIDEAETREPEFFSGNGFVVVALQAAWSAIWHTPVPPEDPRRHLEDALATAIGIGHDTDTVAAIAGALLGAKWGVSAIPARWRRILHGYPGLTGEDLLVPASLAVGSPKGQWPDVDHQPNPTWLSGSALTRHPHDEDVWLSGADHLSSPPDGVTAVVSLCRVGRADVPEGMSHIAFRLMDEPDEASNPNLDFVLRDAAQAVADLRDEGHVVLLHCVAAQSRTPTVAAVYSMMRGVPHDEALAAVCRALPDAWPNAGFLTALGRLAPVLRP